MTRYKYQEDITCFFLVSADSSHVSPSVRYAGGVACSAIEMSQNSRKMPMTPEEVYTQLESIMKNIHDNSAEASEKYGYGYNLVYGANIAGFLKVAEAMTAQGLV